MACVQLKQAWLFACMLYEMNFTSVVVFSSHVNQDLSWREHFRQHTENVMPEEKTDVLLWIAFAVI